MDTETLDSPAAAAATDTGPVALTPGTAVIVRTSAAGVHYGIYRGHNGREVTLTDSRRLWYWKAAKSISLSGVAEYGINQGASRIAPAVANVTLLEACEIIVITDVAATSIREAPVTDVR
jgi:hypothetical protein